MGTEAPQPAPTTPPPGFWWRVLSPLLVVLAGFVAVVVVTVVLLAVVSEDLAGTAGAAAGGLVMLLGALWLRRGLPAHERRRTTALKHSALGAAAQGVNLGVGMVIASGAVIVLGTLIDSGLEDRIDDASADLGPGFWGAVLSVLALVVLAPLAEELLFRGLMLRGLVRRMGFWPAAVVSGMAFGACHIDVWIYLFWPRYIALVGLGVALAWLYRWRGYAASVAAHATVNAVASIALLVQS
jgi:membrane protease YdiL (CAAX protease family)